MAYHAKTQLLFPQRSLLKVVSTYAWSLVSMQTAVLCYAQPLNNGICTAYKFFLDCPFLSHLYEFNLSIKDLEVQFEFTVEIQFEFTVMQNLHLYTQKSVCTTST